MQIKELEQLLDVDRANIRYYEREGLLAPKRGENRYRDYSKEDVDRLKTVILLRKLGIPVAEIRSVLEGKRPLSAALEAQERELLRQRAELDGALSLCRRLEEERVEMDSLDPGYYWEEMHREEQQGGSFLDICRDYLAFERSVLGHVFGGVNELAEARGWHGWRAVVYPLLFVLAFCAAMGLFGVLALEEPSFWDGALIPVGTFLALSALLLPEFLLRKRHPKAAQAYLRVLKLLAVCLCVLTAIWLAAVLLNSRIHFLPL